MIAPIPKNVDRVGHIFCDTVSRWSLPHIGPQALRVTGWLADGTLPYPAGPKTLAEFIVPTISDAARTAQAAAPGDCWAS
jgi:hypothetical protein